MAPSVMLENEAQDYQQSSCESMDLDVDNFAFSNQQAAAHVPNDDDVEMLDSPSSGRSLVPKIGLFAKTGNTVSGEEGARRNGKPGQGGGSARGGKNKDMPLVKVAVAGARKEVKEKTLAEKQEAVVAEAKANEEHGGQPISAATWNPVNEGQPPGQPPPPAGDTEPKTPEKGSKKPPPSKQKKLDPGELQFSDQEPYMKKELQGGKGDVKLTHPVSGEEVIWQPPFTVESFIRSVHTLYPQKQDLADEAPTPRSVGSSYAGSLRSKTDLLRPQHVVAIVYETRHGTVVAGEIPTRYAVQQRDCDTLEQAIQEAKPRRLQVLKHSVSPRLPVHTRSHQSHYTRPAFRFSEVIPAETLRFARRALSRL